jgi:hypothetical protein
MEELFASTTPDEGSIAKLISENKPADELCRDPDFGFIQMGHSHPKGHRNSTHAVVTSAIVLRFLSQDSI